MKPAALPSSRCRSTPRNRLAVIPAKAGIHFAFHPTEAKSKWVPAFAGTTGNRCRRMKPAALPSSRRRWTPRKRLAVIPSKAGIHFAFSSRPKRNQNGFRISPERWDESISPGEPSCAAVIPLKVDSA
jgi:hypothetical protein